MMNGRWKICMEVWYRWSLPPVQSASGIGKVSGGISGSGRQWIHGMKMKGGLKHLFSWMVSLDIFSFYFYVQGMLMIFS